MNPHRLLPGLVVALSLHGSVPTTPAQEPAPAPAPLDPASVAKLRAGAFEAARVGDVKTLAAYFKTGQPAEIISPRGDSLLILACYHGHDDAVKLILDQPKTPINARNKLGFTALTGAAYKGYIGIVQQLAAKGADLNLANQRGQTPLMFAAMFGRTEVVRWLVEHHVDLQAKDAAGKTARDLARLQGKTDAETILEAAEKAAPPVVRE